MSAPSRMPNYDVRNDGIGPYAVFYCETCNREHRSQPNLKATIAKDIGRKTMGGFLRNIPVVGGTLAENVAGEDPRYVYHLTPEQVEDAWNQVKDRFRECPTCLRIVCLSDFDEQSGYCSEDSPRKNEIAESEAEQAGAVIKGLASAFGLGDVVKKASEAAQTAKDAAAMAARCPTHGPIAKAGTKFCPECGSPLIQPQTIVCPNCGAPANGAKFCPECGAKIEPPTPAGICKNCGAEVKGAKFCPECGAKQ